MKTAKATDNKAMSNPQTTGTRRTITHSGWVHTQILQSDGTVVEHQG